MLAVAPPAAAQSSGVAFAGRALGRAAHKLERAHHRSRRAPGEPAPPLTAAPMPPLQPSAPSTPALGLAEAAAVAYWGGQPPCVVTVASAPASTAPLIDSGGIPLDPIYAWTVTTQVMAWPSGDGRPTTYTECAVTLNSDVWTAATEVSDFPLFCGVIVHEYGHMFGHPDLATDPPTSITYPVIGPLNEGVAPCVARYGQASGLELHA